MKRSKDEPEQLAVLAVLAAAAREAEELLAHESELDDAALEEANRRMKQFMHAARRTAQ